VVDVGCRLDRRVVSCRRIACRRLGRLLVGAVCVIDVGGRLDGHGIGRRRIGSRRVGSLTGRLVDGLGRRLVRSLTGCSRVLISRLCGGSGYLGLGRFNGIGFGHGRLFFLERGGLGRVLFE
jgi:hypothetical protein